MYAVPFLNAELLHLLPDALNLGAVAETVIHRATTTDGRHYTVTLTHDELTDLAVTLTHAANLMKRVGNDDTATIYSRLANRLEGLAADQIRSTIAKNQ